MKVIRRRRVKGVVFVGANLSSELALADTVQIGAEGIPGIGKKGEKPLLRCFKQVGEHFISLCHLEAWHNKTEVCVRLTDTRLNEQFIGWFCNC